MKTELIQDIFTMMLSIAGHEDHDDYDDHGKLFLLIQKLTSSDKRKKFPVITVGPHFVTLTRICACCAFGRFTLCSLGFGSSLSVWEEMRKRSSAAAHPCSAVTLNPVQPCSAVALTLYNPVLLYPPLLCCTLPILHPCFALL